MQNTFTCYFNIICNWVRPATITVTKADGPGTSVTFKMTPLSIAYPDMVQPFVTDGASSWHVKLVEADGDRTYQTRLFSMSVNPSFSGLLYSFVIWHDPWRMVGVVGPGISGFVDMDRVHG